MVSKRNGYGNSIKFNPGTPTYDLFTAVIILNIAGRVMGMVVDSVSDVITLTPDQVKPAPEMGGRAERGLSNRPRQGRTTHADLADIDRLMSSAKKGLIEKLVAKT